VSRAASTDRIAAYLSGVAELLQGLRAESISQVARALAAVRDQERTVFTLGNGGSAATALHLANDLARSSSPGQPALRVVCLTANVSLLSALANDFGYEEVFVRQLTGRLTPGDAVVALSVSGCSPNCIRALAYAREQGAVTLGLLGSDGGPMKDLCDHAVHVPCRDYLPVEDLHLIVCHALARALHDGL
jgi:D-sedoheptulose 7-phosphate isomerase